MPVFSHDEHDIKSFRMITSQFYVNGNATQSEISKAFCVSLISVKRAVKCYRTQGIDGFYAPRNTRGAVVLNEAVLQGPLPALAQRRFLIEKDTVPG